MIVADSSEPLHMLEQDEPEMGGHFEDIRRDQAKSDRRMARSTAKLTPDVFAKGAAAASTAVITKSESRGRSATDCGFGDGRSCCDPPAVNAGRLLKAQRAPRVCARAKKSELQRSACSLLFFLLPFFLLLIHLSVRP